MESIPPRTQPPTLRVMTIGPQRARASWQLAGYGPNNKLASGGGCSGDTISFLLQMASELCNEWPNNDGAWAGKSFVEIYAGEDWQHDVEVEPGCSMLFRVAAVLDEAQGIKTAWSNEVSFITQATVPRRPDAPCASCVGTEYSQQYGIQVSWSVGKNGGMPIEQYDVQMSYAFDFISIPKGDSLLAYSLVLKCLT